MGREVRSLHLRPARALGRAGDKKLVAKKFNFKLVGGTYGKFSLFVPGWETSLIKDIVGYFKD